MPVQSGRAACFRAMRRRYTAAQFLAEPSVARGARSPGINLTTDVIVGHPAEDGAAFGRTLAAVHEAGFTPACTSFPYSPRPGTADAASDPSRRG